MTDLATQLSAAYTKELLHNTKDTIHENIERALNSIPLIAAAPHMLEALELATKRIDMFSRVDQKQILMAIAKAKGIADQSDIAHMKDIKNVAEDYIIETGE